MPRSVIVGVDGRSGGRDAIRLAHQLTAPDAHPILATVYGHLTGPADAAVLILAGLREDAERTLREAQPSWPGSETVTWYGLSAGRGLHELARERDADLIVVGSCHRSPPGRVLLGDDAREALFGAPCALAIAPRGHADTARGIETITVGYDGSDESRAALRTAQQVAGRCGAALRALWVVTTRMSGAGSPCRPTGPPPPISCWTRPASDSTHCQGSRGGRWPAARPTRCWPPRARAT